MQLVCSNCNGFPNYGRMSWAHVVTRNKEFVSCDSDECNKIILESEKNWYNSYGPLEYLRNNTSLTVHRTNGDIENDWRIFHGGIDEDRIECINSDKSVQKWVKISDLLFWNPESK